MNEYNEWVEGNCILIKAEHDIGQYSAAQFKGGWTVLHNTV